MEHGQRSTYAKHGCRCDECREAERQYRVRYRLGYRQTFPIKHGAVASYQQRGCRCDECKRANTLRIRDARERRLQREVPKNVHGTIGGYDNWLCRCERCTAANAAASRSYRERCVG